MVFRSIASAADGSLMMFSASILALALLIIVSTCALIGLCRYTNTSFPEAAAGIAMVISAWRGKQERPGS